MNNMQSYFVTLWLEGWGTITMLYTEGHREDQYIIWLCYPLELKIIIIIIIIIIIS